MRQKLFFCTLLFIVSCGDGNYEKDVLLFQETNNLSDEWVQWMMNDSNAYSRAYSAGRGSKQIRIRVVYDEEVNYDPPWQSEAEHMAALETLAELQFPGWDFSFELNASSAYATAIIGYTGTNSFADPNTNTVYLIFEGIFAHEFGHLLGLSHHYCDDAADTVNCGYLPPDEGLCIMSRDSVSWGITEQFLLMLSESDDTAINAALSNINDRYPEAPDEEEPNGHLLY